MAHQVEDGQDGHLKHDVRDRAGRPDAHHRAHV
jgi:hypothetical protein